MKKVKARTIEMRPRTRLRRPGTLSDGKIANAPATVLTALARRHVHQFHHFRRRVQGVLAALALQRGAARSREPELLVDAARASPDAPIAQVWTPRDFPTIWRSQASRAPRRDQKPNAERPRMTRDAARDGAVPLITDSNYYSHTSKRRLHTGATRPTRERELA